MRHKADWYINHKLQPPKAFFEWCLSQIPVYKWTNKKQTILSSDREGCTVISKRLTKSSSLTFWGGVYQFAVILVSQKRIEIQSYNFYSNVKEGIQTVEQGLVNFERFSEGEHIKVTRNYGGNYCFGLSLKNGLGYYSLTRFYENGWKDKLRKISELKYLEIDRVEYWDIETIYKYRKEIEFLQKIHARALAREVMHPCYSYSSQHVWKSVDMRTITQKWLRKNKQFFKNSDRTFVEFELNRRIKERHGKMVPGIEEYLDYRDLKDIPTGVSLTRFQNWVIKNRVSFRYYLDYLGLLKDLNIDPTGDDNLIMPKDLQKAHDNAVELIGQLAREKDRLKNELRQAEYQKTLESRKKLECTIGNFVFKLPACLNDLIVEGKALHHCVGSSRYVKMHSKGETTIIFVRKPEEPDKPFYTLEYRDGDIIQIRGKHNQKPPQDVAEAAEEWRINNARRRNSATTSKAAS